MITPGNHGNAPESDPLRDLGHLADSVAHHVINAFSAIVSNAELIRSRASAPVDPAMLEALGGSMIETALDASDVARRLIDWARRVTPLDAGQTAGEPAIVDLNHLIEQLIESERLAQRRGVDWVIELTPIPTIPGNAAQLRLMLSHLVQNALEALPSGRGVVTFSTVCDQERWVVLTIRDSGCGMTPEVLRRATEPFFSTKPDRSGIGLTIAQRIWRRHRGSFAIDSSPGQGTTIRLSIGPLG
jgi:signal transduction histidine kinase